jgi:hypothetical protein
MKAPSFTMQSAMALSQDSLSRKLLFGLALHELRGANLLHQARFQPADVGLGEVVILRDKHYDPGPEVLVRVMACEANPDVVAFSDVDRGVEGLVL